MIFRADNWNGVTGALTSGLAHSEMADAETASRFAPYIASFSEARSEILAAFVIADSQHVNLVVLVLNAMLDVQWSAGETLQATVVRVDAFAAAAVTVTERLSATEPVMISARSNAGESFTWHSNEGTDKEEMRLLGLALSDWIASQ